MQLNSIPVVDTSSFLPHVWDLSNIYQLSIKHTVQKHIFTRYMYIQIRQETYRQFVHLKEQ